MTSKVENIITATCTVSNNRVVKDGRLIFESAGKKPGEFLVECYDFLSPAYPKFYKMDKLCKLGWLGTEVLLGNFDKSAYKPEDIGIVLSNSNSSLDTDYRYLETVNTYPSPSLFVYTLPNIVIGEMCIRHGFRGENAFFIFKHFDAEFIEQYVGNLLNNEDAMACICGWVDVLDNDYEAMLFLVERKTSGSAFSAGAMKALFNAEKNN